MTNPTMTRCNHVFCQMCIVQWIRGKRGSASCPICRAPVSAAQLTTTIADKAEGNNEGDDIDIDSIVGRGQAVRYILNKEKKLPGKPKMLLFSNDAHAIRKVKKELEDGGVTATTLDGHQTTRRSNLHSFVNGDASVLLLNTTVDGAGLDTLQYVTTSIVFYHSVSNSLRQQIIGRVFRLGRPDIRCNVYDIVHK